MAGIVGYYPEELSTARAGLRVSLSRCLRRGPCHSQCLDFFSEEFAFSLCLFPPSPSLPLSLFLGSNSRYVQLWDPIFAALRMTS